MSMADYHAVIGVVGARPRFFNLLENEPDLGLMKQVKQVTMLGLEGTDPVLCKDPETRSPEAVKILVFPGAIIGFADISLQKTAETARNRRTRPAILPDPPAVPRTGPHGRPSLALPIR